MLTVQYIGCFFDPETFQKQLNQLAREPLDRKIPTPHITFVYEPESIPWEQFGKEVTVNVVGYGNNGENEALKVAFVQLPDELKTLASEIAVPHITLSVAKTGSSVNSKFLDFAPITPFPLKGIFGAMDTEGTVRT